MIKEMVLSLNNDTFTSLKHDFDIILNRTLANLQMKGSEDATITVKLSVNLSKASVDLGDGIREVTKPSFKHDISSVMQIKDKMTGQFSGEYHMVWDEEQGAWVLRRIDDGQMNMFDEEEETIATEDRILDDGHALPAPAVDTSDEESVTKLPQNDVSTPFGWLCQFIGQKMSITEAMGNYAVRNEDNKIVLTSATNPESPFFCPADKLADHVGHSIVCVGYGQDRIVNVSIECEDCEVCLFDMDEPTTTEEEVSEATKTPEAIEVPYESVDEAEETADDGYNYDEPDEE